MKHIKIVIGANFGDEGKGLMTDYFCSQYPEKERVLNVRFNGGAQAGHNVVTPDGKQYIFSHIGAGSFNSNVDTYLTEDFVVNPILFNKSTIPFLQSYGTNQKIFVHPQAHVTIPQDMMINSIVEKHRGNDKHGSCGVGIQQTLLRNSIPEYSLRYLNRFSISDRIEEFFEKYYLNKLKEYNINNIDIDDINLLTNSNIMNNFLLDMLKMTPFVTIAFDALDYQNIIYEGGQGLLLDKDNLEYFPNLTPSNTGIKNVLKNLNYSEDYEIEVCYVTRSYITRHGAGRLDNETTKEELLASPKTETNITNEFQGSFRYAYFDAHNFFDRIEKDLNLLTQHDNINIIKSIAMTHLDETNNVIRLSKTTIFSLDDMFELFQENDFNVAYTSYGNTRRAITKTIL